MTPEEQRQQAGEELFKRMADFLGCLQLCPSCAMRYSLMHPDKIEALGAANERIKELCMPPLPENVLRFEKK